MRSTLYVLRVITVLPAQAIPLFLSFSYSLSCLNRLNVCWKRERQCTRFLVTPLPSTHTQTHTQTHTHTLPPNNATFPRSDAPDASPSWRTHTDATSLTIQKKHTT
ncbi:unnamed protein product [Gadus morhua 'NCC']